MDAQLDNTNKIDITDVDSLCKQYSNKQVYVYIPGGNRGNQNFNFVTGKIFCTKIFLAMV